VPVLSTGIAYHLPIKGQVSHPPSSNFNVSHRQPLEFDSTEAGRGVHDHKERERRGRRRTKFLTLEHVMWLTCANYKPNNGFLRAHLCLLLHYHLHHQKKDC